MTPETKSKSSPEASTLLIGMDPLLEHMKAQGIPLTREKYLELAYPLGAPEPLPAELEQALPLELQAKP